jgi:hypothetical protein
VEEARVQQVQTGQDLIDQGKVDPNAGKMDEQFAIRQLVHEKPNE